MKNKIKIENIFVNLTKNEVKYLPKFFLYVPKPSEKLEKNIDLVISTEKILSNKTKQNISKYLNKTILGCYIRSVNFISSNIPKYIFEYSKMNVGEKDMLNLSTYNLQFLKNLEKGIEIKKCSIFVDINNYILKENWIDLLEDEINKNPKNLIWASGNYYNKNLQKEIKGYLSNPSIYNFNDDDFIEFYYLLKKIIFDTRSNASFYDYDLLIKNNEFLSQRKKNIISWKKKLAKITKEKMVKLNCLMNFINPNSNKFHERDFDNLNSYYENKIIIKISNANKIHTLNYENFLKKNYLVGKNFLIFNQYWQRPANTEERVAESIITKKLDNLFYIGFPWATFIDAITTNNQKVFNILYFNLKIIKKFIFKNLKSELINVTSVQHILALGANSNVSKALKKGIEKEINSLDIKYLFFSHKKFTDQFLGNCEIKSLPLVGVKSVTNPKKNRKYLASFVGAGGNNLYRSEVRKQIISTFKSSKTIMVQGSKEWYYQQIVYNTNLTYKNEKKISGQKDNYIEILRESWFGFCPSGTGPNSIRLWECVKSDVIPIILKNNLDLCGPLELWKKAAIILDEIDTDFSKLENYLNLILMDKEEMKRKFNALRILKMLLTGSNISFPIIQLDHQISFGKSYDY